MQQAFALLEWTKQLRRRFGKCVQVHLVDAISLQWFWLSLHYRVRCYPAIIIDGRMQPVGLGDLAGRGHLRGGRTRKAALLHTRKEVSSAS